MGRGDKKTAKGKRAMGSYGNTRKRKEAATIVAAPKAKVKKETKATAEVAEKPKKVAAPKKPAAEKKAAETKKPAAKKTTTKKAEK